MKFGGTSVGSVKSILSLKSIVCEEYKKQQVIVVVSALGGITDCLLGTAELAYKGDISYKNEFDKILCRHYSMIDSIIFDSATKQDLKNTVDALFEQLKSIYYGVFLLNDLSERTKNAIVSYGERVSSRIVAALIEGALWMDSRDFIKTERKNGKSTLSVDLTNRIIKDTFIDLPRVTIIPGFISRDKDTGETTNLGRGGSDYTAAIIAAALNADSLEIWTDVDGFMTADPRVIPSAYTIDKLSYHEATELCNFGAKVIYPPTIYPVCIKNIPIKVKNTFNPNAPGTIIVNSVANDNRLIKGISSIKGCALITVTGLSMVGVIGVNRRIFTALADNGISVFMVSQASSENSTSIGVSEKDAKKAAEVLNEEFSKEIATGAMYPMRVEWDMATIAIVGENMKHSLGIAGKLFGTLGRSGISVIACSQGASATNISVVVNGNVLNKALNVLHDSFFLSEFNVLNIFICGVGTVGCHLIDQIRSQYEILKQKRRLQLNVVGIANSRHSIFNPEGLDLNNYREELERSVHSSSAEFIDEIVRMNMYNSVFVDCTASQQIADYYMDLLNHNISVIAANKIAASSNYDNYIALKNTALFRGVKFRFETNVGAGLPIISTINDLLNSGDKILKIEAVLSGTLNFIFNEISENKTFSQMVREAVERGYSEPDPRIDLSGADVVRKLTILTRESGYKIESKDIVNKGFLPEEFYELSNEEFWKELPSLDKEFERRRQELEKTGKRWRYVARMENGEASVQLEALGNEHPLYNLEGSNNIVLITTERYKQYPMQIKGYGAGASVTAAGVFANIMSIANI